MKRLVLVVLAIALALPAVATGTVETDSGAIREYDIFLGYPKEDYPEDGTIFGDWLEEQTGVRINWEFLVGDLQQKVGLIAASGDYPDAISPRNITEPLLAANALIPLNDLIDQHGPNIQELYGDRMEMIKKSDGNIYWFPQFMPHGDDYRINDPGHGLYVQKAVLEAWDYEIPSSLEEATDWLVEYALDNPEINGNKTMAYTGLFWNWRWFPVANAPGIFSGHPNDAAANVDWVNGRWVATQYYDTEISYNLYKIYNKIHLAGLYDAESFVMDYDQYLAKLSTGSILGFYDHGWQFNQVQQLLLDQDQDRWYVPIPVVMEGYEPDIANPPAPQVSEGLGISVDAADPEGMMEYFNFLADWETMKRRAWGRKGIDYMVDDSGAFYRTEEQIARWRDLDWVQQEYGAYYWGNFLNLESGSLYPDGINNVQPDGQPSVWKASRRPQELEALEALGVETYAEMFPPPDMRRSTYFPTWTMTRPTGSIPDITDQKINDIRVKYTPLLIMAEAGAYDQVWEEYIAEINKIPEADREAHAQFYQDTLDRRVEAAGGY